MEPWFDKEMINYKAVVKNATANGLPHSGLSIGSIVRVNNLMHFRIASFSKGMINGHCARDGSWLSLSPSNIIDVIIP